MCLLPVSVEGARGGGGALETEEVVGGDGGDDGHGEGRSNAADEAGGDLVAEPGVDVA